MNRKACLIALAALGASFPLHADNEYRFHHIVTGLKSDPCAIPAAVQDGMHQICGLEKGALYPVINGTVYEPEEVDPINGFTCPAGATYATDSQAKAIAKMIDSPVYTPLLSTKPVTCSKAASNCNASIARGIARARDPQGAHLHYNMYDNYSEGQATRYSPRMGTETTLVAAFPNNNVQWSYSRRAPITDNIGVFRACSIPAPAT